VKLCPLKCESDSGILKREEGEEEVHKVLIFMLLHLSNDMALHPMTR
jgi:hypothetical protein